MLLYLFLNHQYSQSLLGVVKEGKKRTSKFSGKKTHPVLTEKLTLDRANIIFL